jgi:hypothetical protein
VTGEDGLAVTSAIAAIRESIAAGVPMPVAPRPQ